MHLKKKVSALLMVALVASTLPYSHANAAEPELLKDINEVAEVFNSYVRYLHAADGSLYFSGFDELYGHELYISDGTQEGTYMLKDIAEGEESSNPGTNGFIAIGDEVFFSAGDGIHGRELWKTDGTEEGTVMVKDIRPGDGSGFAGTSTQNMYELNGSLIFTANTAGIGQELWISDGTEEGTQLLKDINPGAGNSMTSFTAVVLNNELYFPATDSANGIELWKTDGTEEGTVIVADIRDGAAGGSPAHLAVHDGELFFAANDGVNGVELWKTDGTELGTEMVADIQEAGTSSFPMNLVSLPSGLYFFASNGAGSFDLWVSDGTELGTELVAALDPDENGFIPRGLTVVGGELLFLLDDWNGWIELWKTDGTELGTELVLDVNPGLDGVNVPGTYFVAGGLFYFVLEGVDAYESVLWISDGTALGTEEVASFFADWDYSGNSSINFLAELEGEVYFDGGDAYEDTEGNGQLGDITLWKTDGTELGTESVAITNLFEGTRSSSIGTEYYPNETSLNGFRYFASNNGVHGLELWRTDGTEEGTEMVKDIRDGALGSSPTNFIVFNDNIYFQANDGVNGAELWKTDGTEEGTEMVKDINAGGDGSSPARMNVLGDSLIFWASTAATGYEPWISDGTEEGTEVLKDIRAGATGSFDGTSLGMVVSGDYLYFAAADGIATIALWRTDGTEEGTEMVIDITADAQEFFSTFTAFDGGIFFTARNGINNNIELWISDGTEEGTEMVKEINPSLTIGSLPLSLQWLNGLLYFYANDGDGYEMWVSDGTEEGTNMLIDLYEEGGGGASTPFLFQGTVYFVAYFDQTVHLMQTDGTEEGTEIVKVLYEDNTAIFGYEEKVVVLEDEVIFEVRRNGDQDEEIAIWRTNGTAGGTQLVQEASNGALDTDGTSLLYYPGLHAINDETVMYMAYTPEYGIEPWVYTSSVTQAYVPRRNNNSSGGGSPAPSLVAVVDSPNGGEVLMPGTVTQIRYSSNASTQFANLYYSTDNGATWIEIAKSIQSNGSYNWIVPNTETATARIKVELTDLATVLASDTSDGVFAIGMAETVSESDINFEPRLPQGTPQNGMAASPVNGQMQEVSMVAPGQFIKAPFYDTIYFVNENLERQPFLNEVTFATYATNFDQVVTVTEATLPLLPLVKPMLPKARVVLVKTLSENKVYAVQSANIYTQPIKRWIPTEAIAATLYGANWSDYVLDIPPTSVHLYINGGDMTSADQVDTSIMKKRSQLVLQ